MFPLCKSFEMYLSYNFKIANFNSCFFIFCRIFLTPTQTDWLMINELLKKEHFYSIYNYCQKCFNWHIYNRLRSASGLKLVSFHQICTHWCHFLKSRSDLRVFSNRHPFHILRFIADLLVRIRAYISDVVEGRFENVRNGHRFKDWMPIWEFEKKHRFENGTPIWEFEKRT
jgi:hypothetical protein